MKRKTYKDIMKTDDYKISLIRCCNSQGDFCEYQIEGKMKIENTGKWQQDFKARALVSKTTGNVGYVVVEHFLDPTSGKPHKPSFGYIAYNDQEFVDKMPRMKQEYLDKLGAALLKEKMMG